MGSLNSLAADFEQLSKIYHRISLKLAAVDQGDLGVPQKRAKPKIAADVHQVWQKYLQARMGHYESKHGRVPKTDPKLTQERAKLIRAAINRHDVPTVVRAVIGIWLSEFHTGKNDHGKEYTEIERALVIKKSDGVPIDGVEKFAMIYQEEHGEI